MKTRENGRYVFIKTQDDWEDFLKLVCVCGHTAIQHEYKYLIGSSEIIELGGCTVSGHCQQFAIRKTKGKREAFSYA